MTGKPAPNHIDNPEQYMPCKCALCSRCWRHVASPSCIYQKAGSHELFEGWDNLTPVI